MAGAARIVGAGEVVGVGTVLLVLLLQVNSVDSPRSARDSQR